MSNDISSDQESNTDDYENDPYRNRRHAEQCKITWQCPSITAAHSYLPYSSIYYQQQERPSPSTLKTTDHNGFHPEQGQLSMGIHKDTHQDSLLTTITTRACTTSTLAPHRPLLHSTMTTLSLSEEIRKQKYRQDSQGWRRHTSTYLYCCFCCWNIEHGFSWKRLFFFLFGFLVLLTGILLFICLPRIPQISMAQTANTFGQDLDWGPPSHPFYRSTWKLNLTLDNRPNFIPLHLLQMDLTLFIHPSTWNSSLSSTTTSSMTAALDINNASTNLPNKNMADIATPFAWSTLPGMILSGPPQTVNAIFHVNYVAPTSNMTDPTFAQLYQACGPHLITDPPPLNVSLQITFHLLHYPWLPITTVYPTEDNGLICPVY